MKILNLNLGFRRLSLRDMQVNPQQARKLFFQRLTSAFVHSWQCDGNCRLASCKKIKRVITHTNFCKWKPRDECPTCKQIFIMYCYHAEFCAANQCPLSCCSYIKQKQKQKRARQLQQMSDMVRSGVSRPDVRHVIVKLLKFNPEIMSAFMDQRSQTYHHVRQCSDSNCRLPSCKKMKIGKDLIAHCCYHAKLCVEPTCSVSFCGKIKQKLEEMEMQRNQLPLRQLLAENMQDSATGSFPPSACATPEKAFQEISALLYSSVSRPEVQQEILQILNTTPKLMSDFIKQQTQMGLEVGSVKPDVSDIEPDVSDIKPDVSDIEPDVSGY